MPKDLQKITIAIDGHSSCGKSTVAKDLAQAFGLTYIDTGAMYRAVTLYAIEQGLYGPNGLLVTELEKALPHIQIVLRKDKESGQVETWLNQELVEDRIRSLEVSTKVSEVSALAFVRKRMVELQQEMGKNGGVVLDGRDIGTVVFPQADLKLFMTASPEIRAQRRYDEMRAKGEKVSFEAVLENVKSRDHIDSTRAESPLRKADDALVLDNSRLDRQAQLAWVMKQLKDRSWAV
ncbi:(d)CMP kinase [Geofilum rhodophaeum]|uniref:(d)CMP kinase n=1 Tax=Geofilum rhodophaeum TaxID=1965019 RepID=UPI000B527B25|nr:(d)CMP kinase [Geofilum rhodophaeum]